MDKIQYMVHSFNTESIVFRGTEQECLEYLREHSDSDEIELYWAKPGEPHYKEEDDEV